jgi:hypothetical protein
MSKTVQEQPYESRLEACKHMQKKAKGIDQHEDEGNDKRNLPDKFYRITQKDVFLEGP